MGSGSTELFEAAAAAERIPRPILLAAMARVSGIVAAVLLVYFLIPIEGKNAATAAAAGALLGITIILTVFARQMARISRSQRPVLAALEALVLVFGLFLCSFALLHVSISEADPGAYTQVVDKVAGIYFTTTILTTVGFGDISPVSDTARVVVTLQMILGLLLIGSAVKALGFSARRAVTARSLAGELEAASARENDPGDVHPRG
jgi:voltage-gated potassium channel